MEKYFATYAQSLALKKLGFDMPCFRYVYIGDTGNNVDRYEEVEPSRAINFNHDSLCVSQPLKSQVFEWFRKEHHLFGRVYPITVGGFANGEVPKDWQPEFLWEIYKPVGVRYYPKDNIVVKIADNLYKSWYNYEEAESACIDNLIEIVKNNLDK